MPAAVEFVLKARDEATKEIQKVSGELGGLSRISGNIFGSASAIGATVVGLGAIATGVVAAARGYASFAETLDRQARSAGTSTANMQALKLAFEDMGLSGDDASAMMGKLNRAIAEGEPTLKKLGITTRDAFQAFLQLGPAFEKLDAASRAAATQKLLGRAMVQNSGIIDDLAKATAIAARETSDFGSAMDDAAMKGALNLDASLDSIHRRLVAIGGVAAKAFSGPMQDILTLLNAMADVVARNATNLARLASMLGSIAIPLPLRAVMDFLKATHPMPDLPANHQAEGAGKDKLNFGPTRPKPARKPSSLAEYEDVHLGARLSVLNRLEGTDFSAEEIKGAHEALMKLAASFKPVEVGALREAESNQLLSARSAMLGAHFREMASSVGNSVAQTVGAVVSGSASIRQAFTALMGSIVGDVATQLAKVGINLGLSVLSGGAWGVAGGAVVLGAQRSPAGQAVGGVTNNYYSSIDMKSLRQSMSDPSGAMRQANSRQIDVAKAARS